MAYSPVADEHHVVRHCKKKFLIFKDGQVVGVQPEAIALNVLNKRIENIAVLDFNPVVGGHDEPGLTSPTCSHIELRRLIAAPGYMF